MTGPKEELLSPRDWPSLSLLLAQNSPNAAVLAWSREGVRTSSIKGVLTLGHTKFSCAHTEWSNSQPLLREGST